MVLKEVQDFYRFFCKTSAKERQIVFYVEHEGYWPYIEGLITALVDTFGETICYVTSSTTDPLLHTQKTRILPFYIRKILPLFMAVVNCKVFIMTLTDLNHFHLKRSHHAVHYVYVFHALMSTHMVYRFGAFDHYDSVLCAGPYQIAEIRRYEEQHALKRKELISTGYYRLERIYEAYKTYALEHKTGGSMPTILVAPSWGEKNIFELCGRELIGALLDAGFRVIVRPHPEALKRSPVLIQSFVTQFSGNQNFTLEKSVATDDSLLEADVLISDYSGIALEYAFGTERPVLFLDVPPKVRNPRFRELGMEPIELLLRREIGIVVPPDDMNKILAVIRELIVKKDAYRERIQKLRSENIYNFGHSSEIGAKHVMSFLKSS